MLNHPFFTKSRLFGLIALFLSILSGGAAPEALANDPLDHVTLRLRASDLREGLRRASASVGSGKTAAFDWNRVLVEANPASVTLVGTDGRRMTVIDLTGRDPRSASDASVATSLSPNAVHLAMEVLENLDDDVSIRVSADQFVIAQGKIELSMPTAKARFPDWRRVLPKVTDGLAVKVNVGQLLLAATQAAELGSPEHPEASMKLARNKLTVTAGHSGADRAGSEVAVDYDGTAKDVAVNPVYLRSFASLLKKDDSVKMVLRGPRDPILFVTDDGCQYVVMPISRAE